MSGDNSRTKRAVSYWVVLPMARRRGLESRLHAILAGDVKRAGKRSPSYLGSIAAISLLTIAFSLVRIGGTSAGAAIEPSGSTPRFLVNRARTRTPVGLNRYTTFVKAMPSGGKIRLIAVGSVMRVGHAGEDAQMRWWRPDGSTSSVSLPKQLRGPAHPVARPAAGSSSIEFVLEFVGLTRDQRRKLQGGFDTVSSTDGKTLVYVTTITRNERIGQRDATLQIGISDGRAQESTPPLAIEPRTGIGSLQDLVADRIALENKGVPSAAPRLYDAAGYVKLPTSSPTFGLLLNTAFLKDPRTHELEFRLFDRTGQQIQATRASRMVGIKAFIEIVQMTPESAKRVSSVVVDSRSFDYVTFPNIALAPGDGQRW